MHRKPTARTAADSARSAGRTCLMSHRLTAQPMSATAIAQGVLNGLCRPGCVRLNHSNAVQVERYWVITTTLLKATRLSKLKKSAAMIARTVVIRIESVGVRKRGCKAASLAGRNRSSESAERNLGLPRALPAFYPIMDITAPMAIIEPPAGPRNRAHASASGLVPEPARPAYTPTATA